MTTRTRRPLGHVWGAAAAVFVASVLASRVLSHRTSPWPAYWAGLVGLLAVGAALLLSWRALGEPGAHRTGTRRALRVAVAVGAVVWLAAMLFPFL